MIEIDEKRLKQIYSRKKSSLKKHPPKNGDYWSYADFKKWYTNQYLQEPVCYYCGIPERHIETIYWKIKGTKRPATRTRLELDRLDPFGNYNVDNVVLACFNCNNCKSDIFSYDEFKPVGQAIATMWKQIAIENELE